MAISPDKARIMADVLNDPAKAAQLTMGQMRTMGGQLMQFQEEQAARRADMVEQGHTAEEAEQLVQRENQALNEGADIRGGTVKRQVLGGQFFSLAKALNVGGEGVLRAIEGAGDLVNEVAVGLNIIEPEAADNYKRVVRQNRFERKMTDIEQFGKMNSRVAEMFAEALPWMATGNVGGGAGILRYGLEQGMVGTIATTAQVGHESITERWDEALVGGGLGTAGTVVLGSPAWVRRWAGRKFMKELNLETSANNLELERQIQEMLKNESFGFSLAQITGNRLLFGLEAQSAGHAQKAAQNNNLQLLLDHIKAQSAKLSKSGREPDQIALALRATLEKANDTIHGRASAAFGRNLVALETKFGDGIVLDYDGGQAYLAQLDTHLAQLNDRLRPGVKPSQGFLDYRAKIEELVNPLVPEARTVTGKGGKKHEVWDLYNRRTEVLGNQGYSTAEEAKAAAAMQNFDLGGLQVGEINRVTHGLNDMLSGKTAVVEGSGDVKHDREIANGLMGSLMQNLSTNNTNPAAVAGLKLMRDSYKGEMRLIGALEDLVVNRHFGQAKMPADADQALDVVLSGGKTSLENTRKFLLEWEPALLADVQATFLRRIAEKGQDVALPGVDVPINPTKLANALGGGEGVGMKGFGLFDPETQADLVRTGEALRVIKNLYFKGIKQSQTTLDDAAINIIARTPEFMGRFIVRALSGGERTSNALLDPLLRQSIQRIAEGSIDTPTGRAAAVTLARFINEQDDQEAALGEQDRKEAYRAAAEQGQ
jgi:hypothetical protein